MQYDLLYQQYAAMAAGLGQQPDIALSLDPQQQLLESQTRTAAAGVGALGAGRNVLALPYGAAPLGTVAVAVPGGMQLRGSADGGVGVLGGGYGSSLVGGGLGGGGGMGVGGVGGYGAPPAAAAAAAGGGSVAAPPLKRPGRYGEITYLLGSGGIVTARDGSEVPQQVRVECMFTCALLRLLLF